MPIKYPVPSLCLAALHEIERELIIYYLNNDKKIIDDLSPFENSASEFKNKTFHVVSYDWNLSEEGKEQPYNFKWRKVKIWWYKYLGRGMECNKQLTRCEIDEMLCECLVSLRNKRRNKC